MVSEHRRLPVSMAKFLMATDTQTCRCASVSTMTVPLVTGQFSRISPWASSLNVLEAMSATLSILAKFSPILLA